jgi:hypothetical protein
MMNRDVPENERWRTVLGDSSQTAIIVGTLTVLLGFIINATTDKIGILASSLVAAALVLMSLLNAALVASLVKSYHVKQLTQLSDRLHEVIAAAEYDWVISDEQLAAWETTRDYDKITVVSPDLSIDTGSGPFVAAVKANIGRGVAYHYIVPATSLIQGRLPALRQIFGKRKDLFTVSQVDPQFFHILPGHIVIYEARGAPGDIPLVVMESPSGDRHWLRFNESNASAVIGSVIYLSSLDRQNSIEATDGRAADR